jgi:transcriptional regulator with XRE-family HTH domain
MQRLSHDQLEILRLNLRRVRDSKRMTREQVAEAAGISVRFLAFIEDGRFGCSLEVLLRIRRALGCSWEELLIGLE